MNKRLYFPMITVGDFSPAQQLYKPLDELVELEEAYQSGNRQETLKEGIDVIHSVFTFLYLNGYTDKDIDQGIEAVIEKNRKRGYYDVKSEEVPHQSRGDYRG